MSNINFQSTSDGWRGKIAKEFTFDFVNRVTRSIGHYILKQGGNQAFVGYDTRFLSYDFAKSACEMFNQMGIDVLLSPRPTPTPVVSFRTNQKKFVCGINITASHNPYYFNGIKIRMGFGGAPDTMTVTEIQNNIKTAEEFSYKHAATLETDDAFPDYYLKLKTLIDWQSFKQHSLKIGVDTMHGATRGVLKNVLSGSNSEVLEIHSAFDPYFGGIAPEPTEETTQDLINIVSRGLVDLGIAHDGDGDRITAIIPGIGFLSPHEVVLILLWYLSKVRNHKGKVIGSVTMTKRLSHVAKYLGHEFVETPIGFKNAGTIMQKDEVIIAGEENGGVGFGFYLPERDATLAALLLSEVQLNYDGGIPSILNSIEKIVGTSGFSRLNLAVSCEPQVVIDRIKSSPPQRIASQSISKISKTDGLKLYFESGDWVSLRAAGTEELLRIYAESHDKNEASKIAEAVVKIVRKIEGGNP